MQWADVLGVWLKQQRGVRGGDGVQQRWQGRERGRHADAEAQVNVSHKKDVAGMRAGTL
jgi:hypothetical protein